MKPKRKQPGREASDKTRPGANTAQRDEHLGGTEREVEPLKPPSAVPADEQEERSPGAQLDPTDELTPG